MPDIAMCKGGECPLKKSCHRYTAKASEYQSYVVPPPYEGEKCDMYWEWKNIKVTEMAERKVPCFSCGAELGDGGYCTNQDCEDCPMVEFEGCDTCVKNTEESGIEYIQDGYWTDSTWYCSSCNMPT